MQTKTASRPTDTVRLFKGLPNLGRSATNRIYTRVSIGYTRHLRFTAPTCKTLQNIPSFPRGKRTSDPTTKKLIKRVKPWDQTNFLYFRTKALVCCNSLSTKYASGDSKRSCFLLLGKKLECIYSTQFIHFSTPFYSRILYELGLFSMMSSLLHLKVVYE